MPKITKNKSVLEDWMHSNFCFVLAFDPGETTGWCALAVDSIVLSSDELTADGLHNNICHIAYGTIDCTNKELSQWFGTTHKHAGLNLAGENAGIEQMIGLASFNYPKSAVVIEDFIPDMRRMDQARHTLSPVRITSGFSYGLNNENRIFVQDRSNPKTTCTDVRLKNWGLYDDNSGPHARDAMRHAYYFLRSTRGSSEKALIKRWLAWPHLFNDPSDSIFNRRSPIKRPRVKKLGDVI